MLTPRLGIRRTLRRITGKQDTESVARDLNEMKREVEQLTRVVTTLARRQQGNFPLPPEALRLNVGTRTSAANFLAQGSNSSERVLEVFGGSPQQPILDWGCGSGRTLRWLMDYPAWRTHYYGCDVDAEAIAWLKQNGASNVVVCNPRPPLPFTEGMFAGLFAFSVLTHIPAEEHRKWYEELRRVLERGGLAYLTTQGAAIVKDPQYDIPEEARREFFAQGYTYIRYEGHYKDAALVSEEYTRRTLDGMFTVESYTERGYQNMDAFLLRAV